MQALQVPVAYNCQTTKLFGKFFEVSQLAIVSCTGMNANNIVKIKVILKYHPFVYDRNVLIVDVTTTDQVDAGSLFFYCCEVWKKSFKRGQITHKFSFVVLFAIIIIWIFFIYKEHVCNNSNISHPTHATREDDHQQTHTVGLNIFPPVISSVLCTCPSCHPTSH